MRLADRCAKNFSLFRPQAAVEILALNSTHCDALGEVLLENEEDDDDRHGGQGGTGHDQTEVGAVLGLHNTLWSVIFPTVGWPFGVFLMKQFAEGIPNEMLEAAKIDGAGEVRTFVDIVFPMIKPGVGALAIFTFINAWNDYFLQLIMLNSQSKLTISLGIAKMQAEASTDFGLIMAGATLASVPIITIFLIFQKYFTKGITLGAVKG